MADVHASPMVAKPMTARVRQLLDDIARLEDELRAALAEREHSVLFQIRGRRVQFEKSVHEAHLKLRKSLPRWLLDGSARSYVSAPFIYAMVIPLLVMDIAFTLYQALCFRLYRIAPVKRADYLVIDRHHLAYLNSIEKLNCLYCSYANGLLAYVTEIAARTEQYWCPIKHAQQVVGSHARYARFLAYGEAAGYHEKVAHLRKALASRPQAPQ